MKLPLDDFNKIAEDLKVIFRGRIESPQWTLTGELITNPYPVLKVRGRIIRGISIKKENFHKLTIKEHSKNVLSVDASLKTLFDCGTFQIALAKISCSIWRRRRRIFDLEPILRVKMVRSKLEAMEFLFNIEVETVLSFSNRLSRGDYCILDRALMAVPAYKESTRRVLDELCEKLSLRNVRLIGISKSSQLELNTGESLLGHLLHRSKEIFSDSSWYYYPIFRVGQYPKWYLGVITVVKFSADSDHVFRVDINRRDATKIEAIGEILGEIAYLQDPAIPGYPYPPRSSHEEAKIGRQELAYLRLIFLEKLEEEGLTERFIANVKSKSFREDKLWAH